MKTLRLAAVLLCSVMMFACGGEKSPKLYTSEYIGWVPWVSHPDQVFTTYDASIYQFCLAVRAGDTAAVTMTNVDWDQREANCNGAGEFQVFKTTKSNGNDAIITPKGGKLETVYLLKETVSEYLVNKYLEQNPGKNLEVKNAEYERLPVLLEQGESITTWQPLVSQLAPKGKIIFDSSELSDEEAIYDLLVVFIPESHKETAQAWSKGLTTHWNTNKPKNVRKVTQLFQSAGWEYTPAEIRSMNKTTQWYTIETENGS